MKTTETCPKCESHQIIRVPGYIAGNHIRLFFLIPGQVRVSRYLCTECGYSEEWIDKADDIHRLKERYGDAGID